MPASPSGPDADDPGTSPSWRTRVVAPSPGPPVAPRADLGGVGRYRFVEVLGHGGMGIVYRAEDPDLRRHVAVKVLHPAYADQPEARGRFTREAQAQAAIEHDNVVTIHQVGEDDGAPFIVMPLLKGRTLSSALVRDRKPPVSEVLRIGREIAAGLAAAHERGLVHRDIKPGNIWLEAPQGRVKILDFGLARVVAEVQAAPLTAEGMTVGTVEYMAPEQARGQAVDHRTDLFALGVVLYQMLAGTMPFRGTNTIATLAAVIDQTPPPLTDRNPDVPPALNALIQRLMAKSPNHRPASAIEVAEGLRQIADGPATDALAVPPVGEPPPRVVRRKKETRRPKALPRRRTPTAVWVTAGLAALVLVAVVAGLAATVARQLLDRRPQATADTAASPSPTPMTWPPDDRRPGGPRFGDDPSGHSRRVLELPHYFHATSVQAGAGEVIELGPGRPPPPPGPIAFLAFRGPRFGLESIEALRDVFADGVPPELTGLQVVELPRSAQGSPQAEPLLARLRADLPGCRVEWVEPAAGKGPPPPRPPRPRP